jgi:hypothetical protein
MIAASIENAIKPFGMTFEYNEKLMNDEEKERFLKLEKENWKGF